MNKNIAVALWAGVLVVGIGMLFFEPTRGVAPFLIGFGMARLAVVSSRKEKTKKTEEEEENNDQTYY